LLKKKADDADINHLIGCRCLTLINVIISYHSNVYNSLVDKEAH